MSLQFPFLTAVKSAPEASMRRLVHMHIPKTAGTALRTALERATDRKLRIFPHYDERQFLNADLGEWDVFSGHFGFKTAQRLNGDIVTVLRHPVDRFVSVYYFWRELYQKQVEVTRKTMLTHLYSLDEFVGLRDEFPLAEEFFNRMTFQIAHGSSLEHRRELRDQGRSEDEVLKIAVSNLSSCAVIGLQDRMADFITTIQARFGVTINLGKVNVTESRVSVDEIPVATRRKIYDWVYLDLELYEAATRLANNSP